METSFAIQGENKELIVESYFSKVPAGYGHFKLIIEIDGVHYQYTTSNMPLFDKLQSDDDDEVFEAKKRFAELTADLYHL